MNEKYLPDRRVGSGFPIGQIYTVDGRLVWVGLEHGKHAGMFDVDTGKHIERLGTVISVLPTGYRPTEGMR